MGLPFTHLAETELGKAIAFNIVMLGALQQLTGVVGGPALADAVRRRLPAKIVELNLKALKLGHDGGRGRGAARPARAAPSPRAGNARSGVSLVIIVAGVVGLAVATFFLVELLVDSLRRRQFLDIGIAAGVVVLTVWLLFTYGDSLLE